MITTDEIAAYWSGTKGIQRIAPPNQWGIPTADIVRLMAVCRGRTCEVGCGIGRLATFFSTDKYVGVDINGEAIRAANSALPTHIFSQIPIGGTLPAADTYLLWTVALHVPDEQIRGFFAGMGHRVVIVETMDRKFRKGEYAYQRNPDEYRMLLEGLGYGIELYERTPIPHAPGFQDWIVAQRETVR